ncbi:hypothetical protein CLCAR_0505 [Clostridium carboxidivorans P7]|uniref:Uncharacterized protein n=1 Tax=Clostridium scatologenes TaxID=1548 RepID=A0A0E3GR37_CLOSL|nr:hypothetical protein CSCA_2516 [Clostridium scatologenes]EFG89351.1 hypothetical protein CLCAR_0505 [Clostridium carboxidivorans P7]
MVLIYEDNNIMIKNNSKTKYVNSIPFEIYYFTKEENIKS